MKSLKPVFTMFHAAAGLKRLLIVVLAVLLLGVLTILPARASGSGTWTVTGGLNFAPDGGTATLLQNGQVLVTGGLFTSSAELYNPSTGGWITTSSMPAARWYHTATLLSNGQVLVAGGGATTTTSPLLPGCTHLSTSCIPLVWVRLAALRKRG